MKAVAVALLAGLAAAAVALGAFVALLRLLDGAEDR